ncbi:MAG TPA: hypothetical protein VFM96_09000 [Gaiellaceae bacterium]|nr:hypothetical protein [Gaiellaceae bacterium]
MATEFAAAHPQTTASYLVLPTYHTARQAFVGTKDVRVARMADLRAKFAMAGELLSASK